MAPDQQRASSLPTGQERVRLLYEEYIHAKWLMQVWEQPVTEKPELEPVVAAAIHGIELAFLLMAEFINDTRKYVSKRPRIEAMALNIRAQVQLLADMIDGELEEEGQPCSTSLTQDFPFEGCPPTTTSPAHSPGLARLIAAVEAAKPHVTVAELNSLVKVSLQVTSAFQAAFQRWTVGLGIEHQLNQLLRVLGVEGAAVREHETNLGYADMFRPQVVEATLVEETYTNAEDFFFRSIHLGTECWMFVAGSRARSALGYAQQGKWDVASARVMQAARVLRYLGEHILSLTRMNLRDYLELKVQLEGTSGAGSSLVRSIRGMLLLLMDPLAEQARRLASAPSPRPDEGLGAAGGPVSAPAVAGGGKAEEAIDEPLLQGIMRVYADCDKYAGLYNYAKALEDVESALLGGFYHSHYVLATNVIGSEARGTMRRAVAALKASYERPLYPVLDAVRCALGVRFDAQLAHMKGKMMDDILARYAVSAGASSDERQRALIPPHVVRAGTFTRHASSNGTGGDDSSGEGAAAHNGHNGHNGHSGHSGNGTSGGSPTASQAAALASVAPAAAAGDGGVLHALDGGASAAEGSKAEGAAGGSSPGSPAAGRLGGGGASGCPFFGSPNAAGGSGGDGLSRLFMTSLLGRHAGGSSSTQACPFGGGKNGGGGGMNAGGGGRSGEVKAGSGPLTPSPSHDLVTHPSS